MSFNYEQTYVSLFVKDVIFYLRRYWVNEVKWTWKAETMKSEFLTVDKVCKNYIPIYSELNTGRLWLLWILLRGDLEFCFYCTHCGDETSYWQYYLLTFERRSGDAAGGLDMTLKLIVLWTTSSVNRVPLCPVQLSQWQRPITSALKIKHLTVNCQRIPQIRSSGFLYGDRVMPQFSYKASEEQHFGIPWMRYTSNQTPSLRPLHVDKSALLFNEQLNSASFNKILT